MPARDIWSIEDWHEQIQINLGHNVEDIATEYKPARRVRFTLDYVKAHEDPEDGALLKKHRSPKPKGGLGPIVLNRHDYVNL